MSLLNDASLVMIPSGYKDGTLYSAKPTNGDGDFTFSRGSNLAATRVNSEGLIEKGRENLLTYSNDFANDWLVSTTTSIVGGQSGYDGSNDAWLWTAANGTFTRMNQSPSLSGVVTLSIYVKAANTHFVALQPFGASQAFVKFNLSTGGIHETSGSLIDYKIELVGNDWYRCSVTASSSSSQITIYLLDSAGNFANSSTDSIYIQDAQLEQGLVATDYIETTTTTAQAGILEDMPRLDYSGGASCPSLLLEPQRTNYATQSEYIGAWAQSDTTATDNFAVSPEGVQNASKLSASLTSATHFIQLTGGAVGNTATISLFAKADTGSYIQLTNPYSGAIFANFDVATGVVGTKGSSCISSDIEDYGNGWYRCIAVFDNTGFNSNIYRHYIVPSASAVFAQSWQPVSDTSLFIYGHSWEAGSYPTSYIPTYGSSVTRSADSCSKTGISSLIGQTEGTMFLEVDYSTLSGLSMFLSIRPDASNKVEVYRDGGTIYGEITGSTSFALTSSAAVGTHKIAFAYKSGSSALYIDGFLVGQSTTAFSFTSSLVDIAINSRSGGAYNEAANYNEAIVFPTRLTNTELADLTTI